MYILKLSFIFSLVCLINFLLGVFPAQEAESFEQRTSDIRNRAAIQYEYLKLKANEAYHESIAKLDEWIGNEEAKNSHQHEALKTKAKLGLESAKNKLEENVETGEQKAKSMFEKIKEWTVGAEDKASEASENVNDGISSGYQKGKEALEAGKQKAQSSIENAKNQGSDIYESTKIQGEELKRKVEEAYNHAKEKLTGTRHEP